MGKNIPEDVPETKNVIHTDRTLCSHVDSIDLCQRVFPEHGTTGREDYNRSAIPGTHVTQGYLAKRAGYADVSPRRTLPKDSIKLKEQLEASEVLQIYVPKGGEFELVLDDGTHVWMNSETELIFPRTFTGNERRVELVSGEAYFDVSKDKARPFIVHNKNLDLTVLGTRFNIQSYADEQEIVTTLVEGAVRLSSNKAVLRPGEQAVYDKTTGTTQIETVDTELFTAWRHGRLVFKSARLESVLKQLSRWYDVTFVYEEEEVKDWVFSGNMKKYENGNVILGILKATGKVNFVQQDSVIYVKRQ